VAPRRGDSAGERGSSSNGSAAIPAYISILEQADQHVLEEPRNPFDISVDSFLQRSENGGCIKLIVVKPHLVPDGHQLGITK